MTTSNMAESELINAPIRALKRARDFYIRSLWNCSGKLGPGAVNMMGCPAPPPVSTMPRSFSELTSGDEDLRELIRVSSRRSLKGKVGAEVLLRRGQPTPAKVDSAPGRRGVVVAAIGRIDEEKWYTS